jgi:hypothetical protein
MGSDIPRFEGLHAYKYRSVATEELKSRVEQTVLGHQLYYSSWEQLNDPAEGLPAINFGSPQEQEEFFFQCACERKPHLNSMGQKQLRLIVRRHLRGRPEPLRSEIDTRVRDKTRVRIYSASTEPDHSDVGALWR